MESRCDGSDPHWAAMSLDLSLAWSGFEHEALATRRSVSMSAGARSRSQYPRCVIFTSTASAGSTRFHVICTVTPSFPDRHANGT